VVWCFVYHFERPLATSPDREKRENKTTEERIFDVLTWPEKKSCCSLMLFLGVWLVEEPADTMVEGDIALILSVSTRSIQ
jgi:hypothetical protein